MTAVPPMNVSFDDGTTVHVEARPRDMVGAEEAGHDYVTAGPIRSMYATAYAALRRMARNGQLPEGFELAATLEGFMDGADVVDAEDDDPEGKG